MGRNIAGWVVDGKKLRSKKYNKIIDNGSYTLKIDVVYFRSLTHLNWLV
jgi:hypothetical protein